MNLPKSCALLFESIIKSYLFGSLELPDDANC